MKEAATIALLSIGLLTTSVPAIAAPFSSGSNGSYGPLNITSNTVLDVPPDGIFHCTTIFVSAGPGGNVTLSFKPNSLNTPVYLLATGNVRIQGTINVSGSPNVGPAPGAGGPGGFAGGWGEIKLEGKPPGEGQGPGGGRPVNTPHLYHGAFATPQNGNSNTYGNALLMPLIGGSGGSGSFSSTTEPGRGGGGGGGAILIASDTRITLDGSIRADGGSSAGSGSGGAIRLVTPVLDGNGRCLALEGGRVRFDCTDNYAYRQLQGFERQVFSRGSVMQVFANPAPSLRITEAAGTAIPESRTDAVIINLPPGSPRTQQITLQARNFTGKIPVEIVITPENGTANRLTTEIDMAGSAVATKTIDINVPVMGIPCAVLAWKR